MVGGLERNCTLLYTHKSAYGYFKSVFNIFTNLLVALAFIFSSFLIWSVLSFQ